MNKALISLIFTLFPFYAHSNPFTDIQTQSTLQLYDRTLSRKYTEFNNQLQLIKKVSGSGLTLFGFYILETTVENFQKRKKEGCDSAKGETCLLGTLGVIVTAVGFKLLYDAFTAENVIDKKKLTVESTENR